MMSVRDNNNLTPEQKRLLLLFEILVPDGTIDVPVNNGTIRVRGYFPYNSTDEDEVMAYCYDSVNPTPDADPPTGAVACHYDGPLFYHDAVPNAQTTGAGANNTLYAWYKLPNDTNWTRSEGVQIRGVAPTGNMEVVVRATSCIAFAYAENGFTGPNPVTITNPDGTTRTIDDSTSRSITARPTQIFVPTGKTSVAINYVANSGLWTHYKEKQSETETDANGRTTDPPGKTDTFPEYLNAVYHSENLTIPSNNRNRLVAVFGDDSGFLGNVLDVGNSATLTIPANTKYLYLAMHDGYQWNNTSNTGSIKASIAFS